jgi:hypothetical protein
MIEKLPKPIRFDKDQDWLVVARDGEKFYVSQESVINSNPGAELIDWTPKNLLQWATEINYPISKFVRLQKVLVEKFFGL